jgi:small subunit ribosomal protein S20
VPGGVHLRGFSAENRDVANVQSAEKRNRQRLRRRQRNLAQLTKVRGQVKRVNALIAAKDAKAGDALKEAIRAIDKAAQKGVLKKETASRKISRLTKAVTAAK